MDPVAHDEFPVATGDAAPADRMAQHEAAAHDKRNWVRLTYDCNDRCVFCLDADTHDGTVRDRSAIKAQILEGRRAGATRLILSGGEPTIHPDFVAFVRLGKLAGYPRIQTVTNGRMFAYREFLQRSIDAGLSEITFSIHGPDAKIHDALVGVRGAWDEEIAGLDHAIADGRAIVNVDICVNRANVRHLPRMLQTLYDRGVREFDLLQVIPFGRAFREGRDTLFYDLEEARPWLSEALAWSRRPDVHVWCNRFPVEHLEGFEDLIQDPHKLVDEVRGRKEEFAARLDHGVALSCREPARCRYCYVQRLCDHVEDRLDALALGTFDVVRVDATWQARQQPVYGGDPASARRTLPILDRGHGGRGPRSTAPTLDERVAASGASVLWIVAPDLPAARAVWQRFADVPALELQLDDDEALVEALAAAAGPTRIDGRRLVRVHAPTLERAQRLAARGLVDCELIVASGADTTAWLRARPAPRQGVVVRHHPSERVTEVRRRGDPTTLLAGLPDGVPVEGVPPCIGGPTTRPERRVLDAAMLDAHGRPEIFRTTHRFIVASYRVKSRRCGACVHDRACAGLHVNDVRAHGFAAMQPILGR